MTTRCNQGRRRFSCTTTLYVHEELFAYDYKSLNSDQFSQGQSPDTEIGRVYVYDLDDWDLPDKKFYWEDLGHAQFTLHDETGMITMKSGTHDGRYQLRFKVYDRKHTQTDVPANVTVTVKTIPHDAVMNSGSVRISGITDEDFIRVWNYKVLGSLKHF